MTIRICTVLCFAASISITMAAQSEPVLLSANIPIYPPLAAQARIEGIVKLTFTLRANGEPMNVQNERPGGIRPCAIKELKSAAVENVETWRFKTPYAEGKYETELDYRFACSGPQRVTFESFQRVEVVGCPPMHSD